MAYRALLYKSTKLISNGNKYCIKSFSTGSIKLDKDGRQKGVAGLRVHAENDPFLPTTQPTKATITIPVVEDVGAVSGVPDEHIKNRMVRIYQPPKNSMQSGTNNIDYWQIDFDTRERWENPLIGWTSTGDPLSNMKVDFTSKEAAILHCERMGWKYYIQKPNKVDPKPRSYGTNFAWNKRTRVSTK